MIFFTVTDDVIRSEKAKFDSGLPQQIKTHFSLSFKTKKHCVVQYTVNHLGIRETPGLNIGPETGYGY